MVSPQGPQIPWRPTKRKMIKEKRFKWYREPERDNHRIKWTWRARWFSHTRVTGSFIELFDITLQYCITVITGDTNLKHSSKFLSQFAAISNHMSEYRHNETYINHKWGWIGFARRPKETEEGLNWLQNIKGTGLTVKPLQKRIFCYEVHRKDSEYWKYLPVSQAKIHWSNQQFTEQGTGNTQYLEEIVCDMIMSK